jgi:hypothetical protein
MVNDEIYTALSSLDWVDGIYDTKLPDGYVVTGTVLVFSSVSETPDIAIDGDIVRQVARWQVSVRSADITAARAAKRAVIAALHGYSGVFIARCDFESSPGEIFEADVLPFQYHIPIDFMIQEA